MLSTISRVLARQGLLALTLLLIAAVPAFAADIDCRTPAVGRLADLQSRAALRHFVRCAVQHLEEVGWEQAMQDFQTGPQWQDGPMYLFGTSTDGVTIFNVSGSTSPGDQRRDVQDADGKFHVQRMLYTTRVFGGGFVTYRFRNPATESLDLKIAYVHPVATQYQSQSAFLGAGYYPLDAPGACHPSRVRASLVYSLSDAEHFVRCAELHFRQHGLRGLHDLAHDPRWKSGPIYLSLTDVETLIQIMSGGAPALEGTYIGDLEDSTGYRFIAEAAREAVLFGEAIAYYEYLNPVTGQVEPKTAYVRLVEFGGFPYLLGAGVYMPVRPACRTMPDARDVDTKPELELYVSCAADLVATLGTDAFDLLLKHRTWIGGSIYTYVIDQACQDVVYPLEYRKGEEDCDLTDAEGTKWNRNILAIANSDAREGYTSYLWLNPASGEVESKTAYVVGVDLDGERVAVGAGLYGLE